MLHFPPSPRGFVFCTHISSHLPTCTCTSAKSKGSNFLYTSATAKAAPLVIYLCKNNNLAATLLLQLFNTSATAKLQISSTSAAAAAAAKLPTFLYLCKAAHLQLSYKTNQKIVLKFTDYAQNFNSKV
jgi:hypothetical protein